MSADGGYSLKLEKPGEPGIQALGARTQGGSGPWILNSILGKTSRFRWVLLMASQRLAG